MYNPEWFDDEFVPSIYRYYLKVKTESGNPNRPVFLTEKQYSIIAKNSDQQSDGTYEYLWDGLLMVCEERFNKKGDKYYTVDFIDNYLDNYKKTGEYVLNHLLKLRDEIEDKNYSEYAKAYHDCFMSLLKISELDMESEIDEEVKHGKELNDYLVSLIMAIKKFMAE